jgi:putative serine protease PepD
MRLHRLTFVTALAALVLAVIANVGAGGTPSAAAPRPAFDPGRRAPATDVAAIYRKAWLGVVDIKVTTTAVAPDALGLPTEQKSEAEGAGVVFDDKGHILTDQHVVSGATSATVTFGDGTTAKARVIGTDASTDVGVLRVDVSRSKLHPIPFASSATAHVGEPVVAIGSPFGLPETVTTGIVSAVGRSMPAPNNYTINGAIQTDAPINPGNSGGPLLNRDGHVLGLADQIESPVADVGGEAQSAGIGFATPSNTVANVAKLIIAGKTAPHAYIGVSLNPESVHGAEIASVEAGSPAAEAGLRHGDVISAVDGKPVSSTQQLSEIADAYSPGQTVTLTVRRGSSTITKQITLTQRPKSQRGG